MKKFLEIRLACVEDGLDNIGFRKISSYIKSIHSNTKVAYVPTGNVRSLIRVLIEKAQKMVNYWIKISIMFHSFWRKVT